MLRRGLLLLTGSKVVSTETSTFSNFCDASRIKSGRVMAIERRGKWLAIQIDKLWLNIHLGMTGRLDLTPPDSRVNHLAHVHVTWVFDNGFVLRFADPRRFGRVRVTTTPFELINFGPEPMDDSFTESLCEVTYRRRTPIFLTLLDQKVCAGVGSYLAQEALWYAKIAPHASNLSRVRATRLAQALNFVTSEAVSKGGASMRDYAHVDGSRGTMQDYFNCYGRAGKPCSRCGSVLRKSVISGRGVTWCGRCQR
jgi:formamidopyrimidine-DNA glycosylase